MWFRFQKGRWGGGVLVTLRFLGSKRHLPHWLSSKGPNYQRGVLLISAGATETFWRKNAAGISPRGGLVLAWQCPGSPGTCNPEETGLSGLLVSWSPTMFSGSGPVGLPHVPGLKKQLKGRYFSSDAEVIATTETWLDRQPSQFFEWLAKVRATG